MSAENSNLTSPPLTWQEIELKIERNEVDTKHTKVLPTCRKFARGYFRVQQLIADGRRERERVVWKAIKNKRLSRV